MFWIYALFSFLITACGQPARLAPLGLLAAAFGFALFWRSMFFLKTKSSRFGFALAWFFGVQLIQLSWMSSMEYMGPLILLVYVGLSFILGLQFAGLSLLVQPVLSYSRMLALSGLWVFFEWSRLFICTGFTWNPAGLFLAGSLYSLQAVSLLGIYGLSFWVIWVNLMALKWMFSPRCMRSALGFCSLALLPYLFGAVSLHYLDKKEPSSLRALLVQTALLPEQKDYDPERPDAFVPLASQWESILVSIESALQEKPEKLDLIVLPEGALPYGAYRYPYDLQVIEKIWEKYFGLEAVADLPSLQRPEAWLEKGRWKVTNAYWAQALASHYKSDVVIGLDDEQFNAAFLFHPELTSPQRYEKRILVPISEYIPFGGADLISQFVADQFDITQSFSSGAEAKLFQGKIPFTVSICYEETFGEFSREGRLKGAELFVNLTNDAWFPASTLAQQHFDHGMIRSVENGVPLLRACNTGLTGGVDRFGRMIGALPPSEQKASALILEIPTASHFTLYTFWGDSAILWISGSCLLFFIKRRKGGLSSCLSLK